mmetsp:Transcript_23745/g.42474  ORF Transcript_23745/g.42474 Transcript_23745/m.42474 type:complete len:232 (+) Transcript_23745:174-869(+)
MVHFHHPIFLYLRHFFLAKKPMRPACFFFPPAPPLFVPLALFAPALDLIPLFEAPFALLFPPFVAVAAAAAGFDGFSSSSVSETSSHTVTVSVHMYPLASTLVCSTSLFRRFLDPPPPLSVADAAAVPVVFFLANASIAPLFFSFFSSSTSMTSSYSFSPSLPSSSFAPFFLLSSSACSSLLRLFSGATMLRLPSNPPLFLLEAPSSIIWLRACLRASLATRDLRAFSSSR